MFVTFDRPRGEFERDAVEAVALLMDADDPIVRREREYDDESGRFAHVKIGTPATGNVDRVATQSQILRVDDVFALEQGPVRFFHLPVLPRAAFSAFRCEEARVQNTVLVVGGGTMGAGIAFVAARGGYDVELVEPDAAARERARERLAKDAERAGDAAIADRVAFVAEIPAASDAALAIEAVPERIDLKREIVRSLEAALAPGAIIATNTSSLSVAEVAGTIERADRVVGLHFFNPPAAMKLVEVVATEDTSDETLDVAHAFVERIGKTAVDAADTPGFIVNRIARPFYLQSMRALDFDIATVPELDALARAAGFRMGPFELMDLIGLDINYATSVSVYERLQAERLTPIEMQRRMVEQGRLGRKSGAGFYDYADGEPERFEARVDPMPEDEMNLEEVVAVVGFADAALDLYDLLQQHFANIVHVENDEMLDRIPEDVTMIVDVGDGMSDRSGIIETLDARFGAETMLFVDAYASDVAGIAARLRFPERLIGYGILGPIDHQDAVEVVDGEHVSDEALALAEELFEAAGKAVVLVADEPGLYLGRVIGSIVNEAVIAVQEGVASAEDIDTAMRLGVNYPRGPIEWGREIGGRRLTRILKRIADSEGEAYAPHRSLWVLDVNDEEAALDART